MAFDKIFQGQPSSAAAGNTSQYAALGVDTVDASLYVSVGNGWEPASPSVTNKTNVLAQTANNANVVTFVPQVSGIYRVDAYLVSANAPTGATLPSVTAAYTEADTGGSITQTVVTSQATVSAANVVNQGSALINAKAGNNIVIATASYAAGSGTALSYNAKVRIERI